MAEACKAYAEAWGLSGCSLEVSELQGYDDRNWRLTDAEGKSWVLKGDGFTLRVAGEDGQVHAVRLLSWMPGSLLVDVAQSSALYRE
ncbi:hypothetical protein CHLNCDRAFT_139277 [Chlorella variabilis]|uniref:Uncharacterized protein n=1 Tax=Chlorella variabilis TaxID=554065 RepID=E1ZPX8_CHLVA|nr:hypothetical protein CHLNCDRAFT_139277 [Chlorella variabilis]EFN52057.1 hypothetical protein CHLNCDRAFT_139277 [Chlorella variabilis]|eukprot:XP_005844159.1 hypothetical protein CHLNCDRAFT_139277 [Chlorella variabilis]